MNPEFLIHLFREDIERYLRDDPHLRRVHKQPVKYTSPLIDLPEWTRPGILMLTGGRQVGKTTCLKQFVAKIVQERRIEPDCVTFLVGELIRSGSELLRIVMDELKDRRGWTVVVIDEIDYISNWDRAVKFLADAGSPASAGCARKRREGGIRD